MQKSSIHGAFQIFLDSLTYKPGTEIKGRLECNFTQPVTPVEYVKAVLKCTEEAKSGAMRVKKVILYSELVVCEPGETHKVLAGRTPFPITFILPYDIPASFVNKRGGVIYSIEGTIKIHQGKCMQNLILFSIDAPVDLNRCPLGLDEPTIYAKRRYKRDSAEVELEMAVQVSARAAVPGDTLLCNVTVRNFNTNYKTVRIELKLNQHLQYRKAGSLKTLANVTEGVPAHKDGTTYEYRLQVPKDMVLPNFERCYYHKVQYWIYCGAHYGSTGKGVELSVPDIVLGTIPRRR